MKNNWTTIIVNMICCSNLSTIVQVDDSFLSYFLCRTLPNLAQLLHSLSNILNTNLGQKGYFRMSFQHSKKHNINPQNTGSVANEKKDESSSRSLESVLNDKRGQQSPFKRNEKQVEDEEIMSNPVAFWKSWSEKRQICEQDHNGDKQAVCNCFEGVGSVM